MWPNVCHIIVNFLRREEREEQNNLWNKLSKVNLVKLSLKKGLSYEKKCGVVLLDRYGMDLYMDHYVHVKYFWIDLPLGDPIATKKKQIKPLLANTRNIEENNQWHVNFVD